MLVKNMELFYSPEQSIVSSFPYYYSILMSSGSDFLIQSNFLHGLSGSLHLILLLSLLVSWVYLKIKEKNRNSDGSKQSSNRIKVPYFKLIVVSCLGVSLFNLVLCLLNYFYWYGNGWSGEKLISLLDLAIKTLSWMVLSVYLYSQKFSSSSEPRYPLFLRAWWGFYLSISSCCLVIDVMYKKRVGVLPTLSFVSDAVSVVTGLLFCYVWFLGKNEGQSSLVEPLLSGSDGEVRKCRGGETVTPYPKAGIFSIFTFNWISPLITYGSTKTLDLEDVPQLDHRDSVSGASLVFKSKLQLHSNDYSEVTTLKLVKALLSTVWKDVLLAAICALLDTFASYVGPYLIDTFVQYLNGHREFNIEGYALVFAFLLAKLVECIAERQGSFRLQKAGIRTRAVLVTMIYDKGLILSCQAKQGQTTGEIINYMSVDAEIFGNFTSYMHDPWRVLLQVALALIILYKNLGLAAISTFVAIMFVMLANAPLGKLQEKYQDNFMKSKDKRMKTTTEILRNMRILKLQGWEMKFLSKIIDLRKIEAGWLKKFVYTQAMVSFVFWGAPTFVSAVTFGTCMLLGIPLESGRILSALATFRILQEPIYSLPGTISMIAQTKVSLDRIATFLHLDDLQKDVVERLPRGSTDTAVEVIDGIFSWDLSSPNPTLKDINLKVCHGMRVAVCGTVGSGKSSLLSSILGEVPKLSGTLRVSGSKAYVAQFPWIQSGKIEENILFGKEMDRERYNKVLDDCALKKDLEILSFGDQTVIGERGINLSGGQKQRIQIARALYQDSDIYLFDDPFSAVDAHTGSHLYKECLLSALSTKTVIYVTHQVEFLPAADLILVMKDGRIVEAGKYDDILQSGMDFLELVGAHRQAMSELDSVQGGEVSEGSCSITGNGVVDNSVSPKVGKKDKHEIAQSGEVADAGGTKGQLVQEEEREKGQVGFSVFWKFIRTAYGGALVPFILFAQIVFQLLQIGGNYWMAWATPVSEDVEPRATNFVLITVYVVLAVASSLCVLVRSVLLATAAYKTATLLFNKMHCCIFRAPMSFFDATPSGRILIRASSDQSTVDTNMYQVAAFAFSMIQLLGTIAMMSQVAWQVFIIFVPVIATCVWYQQYYIPSARELSRLVGLCKAPVIQNFAETISGSTTIRSFDQESRFRETNMKLSDDYSRPKFHIAGAMEWLRFRLDMLSAMTFGFILIFLTSVPEGFIDPAIAGLAVTYGLNLNILQARVIWNLCQTENKIISVERILQYSNILSEPPLVIKENRPDNSWPSKGEIDIRNLQVRYAPYMPLVLRGIACIFPGGMRSGIVGRTGSGKSTLIQTLFRIVEPAAGQILIDGVNISIGLHDLRSRLSIIPQDPTMFEGTVRSNLDPLEEYTDDQIWEALDKCQLGDEVRKKEGKLDSTVTENGENWSMGQRQLVCLGRVLLKKSKVLVLDEATASVDTATDNLIQQTLRLHFSDCTVITIAHRITSVVDSDMVLLLDHGLIDEYDSPKRLLENKSSSFAKLVAEYTMRSGAS